MNLIDIKIKNKDYSFFISFVPDDKLTEEQLQQHSTFSTFETGNQTVPRLLDKIIICGRQDCPAGFIMSQIRNFLNLVKLFRFGHEKDVYANAMYQANRKYRDVENITCNILFDSKIYKVRLKQEWCNNRPTLVWSVNGKQKISKKHPLTRCFPSCGDFSSKTKETILFFNYIVDCIKFSPQTARNLLEDWDWEWHPDDNRPQQLIVFALDEPLIAGVRWRRDQIYFLTNRHRGSDGNWDVLALNDYELKENERWDIDFMIGRFG